MQTPSISERGTPELFYSNTINSSKLGSTLNGKEDHLKRSFEKYLSSAQMAPATGGMFDPKKHLDFIEPTHIHTMEDIGYPATNGISPVAVSEPFRLFNEEAVDIMRSEILAPGMQEKYGHSSNIAPNQLRGYPPQQAKFIFQAWKHPETLSIISKIAGIELVPQIDYDIGHINMSVPKSKADDGNMTPPGDDDEPIVGWHRDSYPFVCVLMMSDTTGMIGGETALRTGTGEIKKVRGPQKGYAVVLQGRYINHEALATFGGQERITMVTSFRPRSPYVRDDTVLTTVRPISDLSDLYGQVMEYQLENAETRIRGMLKTIRESMKTGSVNAAMIKSFLGFEIEALQRLNEEIVDEASVQKGHLSEEWVEAAKRTKI